MDFRCQLQRKKAVTKAEKYAEEITKHYKIGTQGQKRPLSDEANAVRIVEIATGLRKEEYMDPPKEDDESE